MLRINRRISAGAWTPAPCRPFHGRSVSTSLNSLVSTHSDRPTQFRSEIFRDDLRSDYAANNESQGYSERSGTNIGWFFSPVFGGTDSDRARMIIRVEDKSDGSSRSFVCDEFSIGKSPVMSIYLDDVICSGSSTVIYLDKYADLLVLCSHQFRGAREIGALRSGVD